MKIWSCTKRVKRKFFKISILTCISLLPYVVRAEYRAFQYLIKSDTFTNTITSARSPQAFKAYHGGPSNLEVNLLKTWICPGYTGQFKPICPSPESQIVEQLKERAKGANQ
jgi:hypothetical protein